MERTGLLGNVGSLVDEGTAWQDGMKLQAEGRPGLAGLTGAWSFIREVLCAASEQTDKGRF